MSMPYYRSPVDELEAMVNFFKKMENDKNKEIEDSKRKDKEKSIKLPRLFTFGEMVIILIASSIPLGMLTSWAYVTMAASWFKAMQSMLK